MLLLLLLLLLLQLSSAAVGRREQTVGTCRRGEARPWRFGKLVQVCGP
jgi:hypothetical protein